MSRYFLEVAYKGTRYSGFQVQENAVTIQSEIEKAFQTLHRQPVELTGSSRTDAGVHALQNFFHFDFADAIHSQAVYKLNAILPEDIVVKNILLMPSEAHCRFDAVSREYTYKIHRYKSPFLKNASFYYPYKLDADALEEGAAFIKEQTSFFSFAKTNTQVNNFNCQILKSQWHIEGDEFRYQIEANRFLRGMVRLLTATLLQLGRGRLRFSEFRLLFNADKKCGFSVPAHGLYLLKVIYPQNFF